jgi:hypothetical protein
MGCGAALAPGPAAVPERAVRAAARGRRRHPARGGLDVRKDRGGRRHPPPPHRRGRVAGRVTVNARKSAGHARGRGDGPRTAAEAAALEWPPANVERCLLPLAAHLGPFDADDATGPDCAPPDIALGVEREHGVDVVVDPISRNDLGEPGLHHGCLLHDLAGLDRVDDLPHHLGEVVGAVLILPAVNSPRGSSDLHSRIPDCCISLDGRLAAAALAECCQRGLATCAIPAAPARGRNAGTSTDQSQNGDHPGRRDRSAPSRWNRRIATWGLELLAYTRVQGSGRRLSSWRHPHPAQAITACSRCEAKGRARRRRAGDAATASRPRYERGRRPWLCRCHCSLGVSRLPARRAGTRHARQAG